MVAEGIRCAHQNPQRQQAAIRTHHASDGSRHTGETTTCVVDSVMARQILLTSRQLKVKIAPHP